MMNNRRRRRDNAVATSFGPHVLVTRVISFSISTVLLSLGSGLVVFPSEAASFLSTLTQCNSGTDTAQNLLLLDPFSSHEILEKLLCRMIGCVLLTYALSTLLLLLQFTMRHGIRCFSSDTSNSSLSMERDPDHTIFHQDTVSNSISDEALFLQRAEMSKCRSALVSHALLGLLIVFMGLLSTRDDIVMNDACTDFSTIGFLLAGSIIVASASIGLMTSFWPVLIQYTTSYLHQTPATNQQHQDINAGAFESPSVSQQQQLDPILQPRQPSSKCVTILSFLCGRHKRRATRTNVESTNESATVPLLQDVILNEQHVVAIEHSVESDAEPTPIATDTEPKYTALPTEDQPPQPSPEPPSSTSASVDPQPQASQESRITGVQRLLQLVAPEKPILYIACIVLLLRLPFSLAIPHFVSTTYAALEQSQYHAAKMEIGLLFVIGTIDAALDFWCVYLFGLANLRIVRTLRVDTFSSILQQEMSFFDNSKSGELASRLTADCGQMASELTWVFRFSIEAAVRITGIAIYMVVRSPQLGGITLCIIPLIALINKQYGAFLERNAKVVQEALAEANAVAQETFACIRTVIAFAAEDAEIEKYSEKNELGYNLNLRALFARAVYYMLVCTFLVNTVTQGTILFIGVILIEQGQLTPAVLLSFMLYHGQLQEYTLQLMQSYSSLLRSSGAGDVVFGLLDRVPPPPGTGSKEARDLRSPQNGGDAGYADGAAGQVYLNEAMKPPSNSVDLVNVDFCYPSRPHHKVLSTFTLSIPSGDTVALVGCSGCGKSTVVGLIERYYDPIAGSVLVGGADLRTMNVKRHRLNVGIVTQDPVLLSGTILSNITYGYPDATLLDAMDAARLANAHTFIESFAKGYFTEVGERGIQLSGGQKQRIAIARAILKRPSILLLDEATSSLDNESERLVQDALDRLLMDAHGSVTTVVVAHRLQTVRNADKIVVISEGRVVEQGSHEALRQIRDGYYNKMIESSDPATGVLVGSS